MNDVAVAVAVLRGNTLGVFAEPTLLAVVAPRLGGEPCPRFALGHLERQRFVDVLHLQVDQLVLGEQRAFLLEPPVDLVGVPLDVRVP